MLINYFLEKNQVRKQYLTIFVIVFGGLWLWGCAAIGREKPATNVPIVLNVCYSSISAAQTAAIFAQKKGLYTKHGLEVNLVYIDGGSTAVTTLISGEMDICQVGGAPVANAVVAGEDLVLVAGLFNRYAYALLVAPNIDSPAALRGQSLAISSPGSSSDGALRALLPTLGLEPDRDVTLVEIGGQSERIAAMEAGVIAGTLVSVPESAKARMLGYRELVNMLESDLPYSHNSIATSRRLITNNREAVSRFLRATVEAIVMMKADKESTIALLAQFLELDAAADRAALEEAYQVFIVDGLSSLPWPTEAGLQQHLDALATEIPDAVNVTAGEMIDTSFLTELEQTGFVTQLESR